VLLNIEADRSLSLSHF